MRAHASARTSCGGGRVDARISCIINDGGAFDPSHTVAQIARYWATRDKFYWLNQHVHAEAELTKFIIMSCRAHYATFICNLSAYTCSRRYEYVYLMHIRYEYSEAYKLKSAYSF